MKVLLRAIIVVAIAVGLFLADQLLIRSSDEAAFAQLPAPYQKIAVYPNAQNVWRGTAQQKIIGFPTTRITTFTTSDSTDKVMHFYRSTLPGSGWEYDTHGDVTFGCAPTTYYNGDFYANAQNDHVWVAAKNVGGNTEYQIFKVSETFWMYGECP
jgi:hypothetical protein